jgi:hypothetical protein
LIGLNVELLLTGWVIFCSVSKESGQMRGQNN